MRVSFLNNPQLESSVEEIILGDKRKMARKGVTENLESSESHCKLVKCIDQNILSKTVLHYIKRIRVYIASISKLYWLYTSFHLEQRKISRGNENEPFTMAVEDENENELMNRNELSIHIRDLLALRVI